MFIRFRKSHWRLKVYIAENARRDGKVAQTIVSYLGSIDTRALMLTGDDDREREALQARIVFWEAVNPKLKNLENRLGGAAEAKRLRLLIHARIPWPMEVERERLEVLKADAEAALWFRLYQHTNKMLEINERQIAKAEETAKDLRRDAMREMGQANKWQADAATRRQQLAAKRAGK